jgi:hypothetical protein
VNRRQFFVAPVAAAALTVPAAPQANPTEFAAFDVRQMRHYTVTLDRARGARRHRWLMFTRDIEQIREWMGLVGFGVRITKAGIADVYADLEHVDANANGDVELEALQAL